MLYFKLSDDAFSLTENCLFLPLFRLFSSPVLVHGRNVKNIKNMIICRTNTLNLWSMQEPCIHGFIVAVNWTSLTFNSGYWRSFQIFRIFLISSIQTFCITFQYAEGNTDYCNLSRMIINEEEINLLDIELSNIYFPNFTKLRIYYKSWKNVLMEKKLS